MRTDQPKRLFTIFFAILAVCFTCLPAAALTFDLDFSSGIGSLPAPLSSGVMTSVSTGVGTWESTFFDPIVVTVSIELDSEATDVDLGTSPSVFAAAINKYEEQDYTAVAGALAGDATSLEDIDSLSLHQTGPYLEALTHDTSLSPGDLGPGVPSPEIRLGSLAAGTTGAKAEAKWNSVLKVSSANSKALGLPVTPDAVPDIRFIINDEALPGFDFDRGDGIGLGLFDFMAVVMHEIGHGMGFVSGVDDIDYSGVGGIPVPMPAPDNPIDLSDDAIFSVLDLYRTNVDTRDPGIALGQPVGGGFVLDWRFGPPIGPVSYPFFSLEAAGVDPPGKVPYSTGAENGTGGQASHWLDTAFGLMGPSLDPEVILDPSGLDIVALDVIGWDTIGVPEPASLALLAVACGCCGCCRRRT